MADISDINKNEPEVVFKDKGGNYAVVIAARPPNVFIDNVPNWRLGDWNIEFALDKEPDDRVHMSLMALENAKYPHPEDGSQVSFPQFLKDDWQEGITRAILRRAMYLMLKHFNITTPEPSTKTGMGLSGPDAAIRKYEDIFIQNGDANIPEGEELGISGDVTLFPPWNQAKYYTRPGVESPYRWVVTFERAMIERLRPDDPTTENTLTEPLAPFEAALAGRVDVPIMRADKRFRQTFGNVSQFEMMIDMLVENLNRYQDEINDSIWYYTYPGEEGDDDEPVEVDLKFLASLVRDAGTKISDFLYSVGASGDAPFEIGFQEFVERNMIPIGPRPETFSLTAKIRPQVTEEGYGPGIRYIGAPIGGDKDGVNVYHLPEQAAPVETDISGLIVADQFVSAGLNTLSDDDLFGLESMFNKLPFTDDRLRYLLANLTQIIENDLGGAVPAIPSIPNKEEAAMAATVAAGQILQNPCGEISAPSTYKSRTEFDEFVEKRLCPTPESNFRKQSLLDFANQIAGFDLSFKSLKDIDIELDLTASDVLEELMEERNTNLNDYVADMVYNQFPSAPSKVKTLADVWKYVLARIDIPTFIAKYLACIGLDVSLNDLIEWVCDEMIRTVDQETDGGLTEVVEYLESGEFVPGGEYVDLTITDVVGELKVAIAKSVNTGMPAADSFLQETTFNTKRLICAALVAGPFAAVSALIWLLQKLLALTEQDLDEIPAKKKCDVTFDFPDEWPLLETLWDLVLREAERRLEKKAREWLEKEIIEPIRNWLAEIIEECEKGEDEYEYGSLPAQLIAPQGMEEVAGPYFMGEDGAGDFLERLLGSLTPSEICMLLDVTRSYEDPELIKILNFIMEFTRNPINEAPASAIGAPQKPGRLGSPANIIAFFNSISSRLDTSICDRLQIIPDRTVSELCDDLSTSDKEASFISNLSRQGLSKEDIEQQLQQHRDTKEKLVRDAIKTLAQTGNLSKKLEQQSKEEINQTISDTLQSAAGATIASFFTGIPEMSKVDLNNFTLVLTNTPFIRRVVSDMETFMKQYTFYKPATTERNQYHNYKIAIQSAQYLEAKALDDAINYAEKSNRCEEWRRHVKLMKEIQAAMEQDLLDGSDDYWDYDAAKDVGIEEDQIGDNIWETYQGQSNALKRKLLTHTYLRHPHPNLIAKYKSLTPEEFDDLAVIAFRYYSRFTHDYTNLDLNKFSQIQLNVGSQPYGSFFYNPLVDKGGVQAWWGYLGNVNFRYGTRHIEGHKPWFHNPPGPDPEEKALPLYKLVQRLHAEKERNDGSYKIFRQGAKIVSRHVYTPIETLKVNLVAGDTTTLRRTGNFVPANPVWSLTDIKTILVQLLLFVWDRGKDEAVDFPIFHSLVIGESSSAWKENFYGGHLMRALQFYDGGLSYIPGFPGPGGEDIVGDTVNLVEGKWVGHEESDQYGFFRGYVPKHQPTLDEDGNIVLPEIISAPADAWQAGLSEGGVGSAQQVGGGEGEKGEMQFILLNPKTGKKAPWIPAPRPTPWRLLCKVEAPKVKSLLEDTPKDPTYNIIYGLRKQDIKNDKKTDCLTDRYSFFVYEYPETTGQEGRYLVSYGNYGNIKLFDDLDPANKFYSLDLGKSVLEEKEYNSSWTKLRKKDQPAAPQIFADMIMENITNIVKNRNRPGQGSLDTSEWNLHSPYAMLYNAIIQKDIGMNNLYGVVFRDLLRRISSYTIEYGIGSSLRKDNFSSVIERMVAGSKEVAPRLHGSKGDAIIDVTDIRNDTVSAHKKALQKADFLDISKIPSLGRTLLSFPERDPSRFVGKTEEEIKKLQEEEKEDRYPSLLRVLVRLFVAERILKAYLICGTYNIKKIGSEEIIKEFVFAFMKESGVEELIGDLVIRKASEAKGEDVSFEDAVKPIIEEEVKNVAKNLAAAFKPNIGEFDGDVENLLTLPKIYDLASLNPTSNATVIGAGEVSPKPHMVLTDLSNSMDKNVKYQARNNTFTKFRFFNLENEQQHSGFVLEKYIKVQWKQNLKKIGGTKFFKAWEELPIELRGYPSNVNKPDGYKLPVYLNVEDFAEKYADFFNIYDYVPKPSGDETEVSIFAWKQLGNTSKDFYNKLDDLHNKVHDTQSKQGPGDRVGKYAWSTEMYGHPDLSISRSAEIQRHIALMERLLSRFLKRWGHPDRQGYKRPHKDFRNHYGYSEDPDGTPLNSDNHTNSIMPGTKQRWYGITNYVGKWSAADSPCSDPDGVNASDDDGCLIANDSQAAKVAGTQTWWTDIKDDLIRWEDLEPWERHDLAVIAFRFYSRYWFGDFTAFSVDPVVEQIPGWSEKEKFFKRGGYLDRSCNPRNGLRVPGSMYYHSWESFKEVGFSTQFKGAYSIKTGGSKGKYHIPPTYFDLFKFLFAQRQFYGPLDNKDDVKEKVNKDSCDRVDIAIAYKTPCIQKYTKAHQYSWELPTIDDPSNEATSPEDLGLGETGKTDDWNNASGTTPGTKIHMGRMFENLAKLLCYSYEIGDARRRTDSARKYTWPTKDPHPSWNDKLDECGFHTNSHMGEKYTALFGGHLYYALQYYKEGLQFIQQLDKGAQFAVVGDSVRPTPLDIFTKDKSGESNLVNFEDVATTVTEELQDIAGRPLTDFMDIKYGLRLSYLLPKDKPGWTGEARQPLSSWKNGRYDDNLWTRIKTAITQPLPGGAANENSDIGSSRLDFLNNTRRVKTFLLKEGPDTVTEEHLGNDIFLLPLVNKEIAVHNASTKTIDNIAKAFDIKRVFGAEAYGTSRNPIKTLWSNIKSDRNFKLLFEYIFPLQRMLSMLVVRDSLNFDQSSTLLAEAYNLKDQNVFRDSKQYTYDLINLAIKISRDPSLEGLYQKNIAEYINEMSIEEVVKALATASNPNKTSEE